MPIGRIHRSLSIAAAVCVTFALGVGSAGARGGGQPGDPDPSFGNNGKVEKAVGAEAGAEAVATLASGKLMVAGFTDGDLLLMRFTANGHVDNGFDGDGKVTLHLPGKSLSPGAMAIVGGGRILVAGGVDDGQPGGVDVFLARFLANGQPDASFGGGDGRVVTDLFGGADGFEDLAVGSDGRAVVAAMSDVNGTQRAVVARWTAGGALDHSFSADGKFALPNGAHPFLEAVTVLPSLKVVAAGQGNPNGSFDFVLYGVTAAGKIDQGFGTFGLADTDFDSNTDVADALAVDGKGRIVAGGAAIVGGDEAFGLARYTANGQPDPKFSGDGKVSLKLGNGIDRVFALGFQGTKILAGGRSDQSGDEQWGLARFGSGGKADPLFGASGATTVNFSTSLKSTEQITSLTFEQATGRIVGCGFAGGEIALAGFLG